MWKRRRVLGVLLTTTLLMTLGALAAAGSIANAAEKRIAIASTEYNLGVTVGTSLTFEPEVNLGIQGGPPGVYLVVMVEGTAQNLLGTIRVGTDGAGSGNARPVFTSPGTHSVRIVVRTLDNVVIMTSGVITITTF
ncbi:MAG: hypothetical protein HY681_10610 [Chloroflexi bacterium]|nr:hypothetical protein [Chloroflexota bacterium]